MKIKLELILISTIILIYLLLGIFFQKQISHNNGLGWDGQDYYKIALDFKESQFPEARAPFVYRMGTSFLVAKFFPNDMQYGFRVINIAAGILVIYALWYFLLINSVEPLLRTIFIISYISYWQNPFRLSFFYPVHSDPLGVLFLFINLIFSYLLFKKDNRYLFITFIISSFVGVFFREITLIPAFVLFISQIKIQTKLKVNIDKKYLLPLIFGLIAITITHLIGTPTDTYSFFNSAVGWIYRKSTIMYIHSLLMSVGPIVVIGIYFYKDSIQYLKKNKFLSIFLIIIFFISYAGGSDTERLLMWGIPGIYLLLSNVISSNKSVIVSKLLITVLIISQLISNRAFLLIPDYNENALSVFPFLTPISNNFPLLDLWVIHANSRFILISAIEYFLLSLLIIFLIKFSNKLKQI